MKDLYYTPTIEEFHIGLEYEVLTNAASPEKEESWDKEILEYEGIVTFWKYYAESNNTDYRVKYLDQEDIESFGWKYGCAMKTYLLFHIKSNILFFNLNGNYIRITEPIGGTLEDIVGLERIINNLFSGNIKNKSELKKLMQQLGI